MDAEPGWHRFGSVRDDTRQSSGLAHRRPMLEGGQQVVTELTWERMK